MPRKESDHATPATGPDRHVERSDLMSHDRVDDPAHVHQPILPDVPPRPPQVEVPDTAIAAQVLAVLDREGRLADAAITLVVQGGVVTLEGKATSEFQRSLATATVHEVPGVLNVQNRLRVS